VCAYVCVFLFSCVVVCVCVCVRVHICASERERDSEKIRECVHAFVLMFLGVDGVGV